MTQQLPPGQGPIDPRGAFGPPPPPGGAPAPGTPTPMLPQQMMPQQMPFPQFVSPPPPRRGAGWGVLMAILILLLILSVVMNLVLGVGVVAVGAFDGRGIEETKLVSGASDQLVAVIPLEGVLTDASRKQFDQFIRNIEDSKDLKGIVIDIDSPGGEVTPSDEIYQRILKLKSDHPGLQVAASIRGMGASGAYYAACGCDHIIAEETTITGSIGVLWPNYNFADLMQKYGVKDTTIVSDGAPYKDAGSPTQPPNPEHEGYLRGLVNGEFVRFKAIVQKSRGPKLKPHIDEIANGKAYTAPEAKQNGLIDDIGYLDKAVSWITTAAHLSSPTVIRYDQKGALFDHFPFARQQGSPKAELKVDGMNVEIDQKLIDRFAHPRPMAIGRGS
jgi:protease-4